MPGPSDRCDHEDLWSLLRERSNWGRWGSEDQRGAANLVTDEKRVSASRLVRAGRSISLSRPFPSAPSPANRHPAHHVVMAEVPRHDGGMVLDYYGIAYHGIACTHMDALCHVWDVDGMWGGRAPSDVIRHDGVTWGGIEHQRDGLFTRGVLFDVPRFRGTEFVDADEPVHASELEAIAAAHGLSVEPGDALVVYCGREAWGRARGEWGGDEPVGDDGCGARSRPGVLHTVARPGLHASCLEFIRDSDCSALVWDMMDATPTGYTELAWAVHAAIWAFGVTLVDNALLEPLAEACRELGRSDFLLTAAPLVVEGGTGSPVNPLAVL
jgi:kynurenine formamidase